MPRNDQAFGGVKVMTENGWFAARPSGTEDIYKIYAESFVSEDHLKRLVAEAQVLVDGAISPGKTSNGMPVFARACSC